MFQNRAKKIPLHRETIGTLDLFSHTPFTNGVSYVSLVLPLPNIPMEDLWILRLFSLLLTQVGCGNRSYQDSLEYLQSYTGGAYAQVNIIPQASDPQQVIPSWILRGKCLDRNLEKLFSILSDFLFAPRYDERKRIREVVEKHGTDLHNALQSMALDYALSKAGASVRPAQAALEELYGLSYYKNLKTLISSYTSKEKWFIDKLIEISSKVLHNSQMHALFCGDAEPLRQLKETSLFGLAENRGQAFHPWTSPEISTRKEDLLYLIPSNVSFTALTLPTIPYLHRDAARLSLLSALMNNTFLHKRLREQGGAYGGGSSASTSSGTFSFYSYRDPNLFSTFQAYKDSVEWIKLGRFTSENLEEAKLSILQDLDNPIPPGNQAEVAYFWWRKGKTEEARQQIKDGVQATTKEELQALISKYFNEELERRSFVAFTNKEIATKNSALFEKAGRMVIKKQV